MRHVDASLLHLIARLQLDENTCQELHGKIQGNETWKNEFDRGGNIRLLEQLFARVAIRSVGLPNLGLGDFEQAFRTLRYGVPDSSTPPTIDESLYFEHLAKTWSAAKDSYSFDAAEVASDIHVVRGLIAFWSRRGSRSEPLPKLSTWAKRPHEIIESVVLNQNDEKKWETLVLFGLLSYLRKWDVRKWTSGEGVNKWIRRAISDDRLVEYNALLKRVFGYLGYTISDIPKKGGQRSFYLVDLSEALLHGDLTLPNRNEQAEIGRLGRVARITASANANTEYFMTLIQKVRSISNDGKLWEGEFEA